MLALRPEGTASVVRAYLQHRPALPYKAWYVGARLPPRAAPGRPLPPAPPARHRGARGGRPRPRRRGDLAGRQLPGGALGLSQIDLSSTRSATRTAARPIWNCSPPRSSNAATSSATSTATGSRPTRCGSSTASGPSAGTSSREMPRIIEHLCDDCAAHFARVREGLDAFGVPVRARPPLGPGPRLLHAHHLRVLLRRARGGPERRAGRRSLRRARRRPWAGRPTPGIGFGSGIERAAAGLRRRGDASRSPRGRSTPSWWTWPAARPPAQLTTDAASGRAGGRPGLRRPVDEGPAQGGRPLRRPRSRSSSGPRSGRPAWCGQAPARRGGPATGAAQRRGGGGPAGGYERDIGVAEPAVTVSTTAAKRPGRGS